MHTSSLHLTNSNRAEAFHNNVLLKYLRELAAAGQNRVGTDMWKQVLDTVGAFQKEDPGKSDGELQGVLETILTDLFEHELGWARAEHAKAKAQNKDPAAAVKAGGVLQYRLLRIASFTSQDSELGQKIQAFVTWLGENGISYS